MPATATKVDVATLSPAEREATLRELLGENEYDSLMKLKAKSQTKEQKKAVKGRAKLICGLVKDAAVSDEDKAEFSDPYNAAKAEMGVIMDKALARATSLIEQEERTKAA